MNGIPRKVVTALHNLSTSDLGTKVSDGPGGMLLEALNVGLTLSTGSWVRSCVVRRASCAASNAHGKRWSEEKKYAQ